MFFKKTFPDKLKSQIKISDVIGKRLLLKNQSNNKYIALCPFHKEKTPSFHIDDNKEFYHCFGCAAHGDIVTFTMEIDNLPFNEAVIKIANDYNIEIPYVKTDKFNKEDKSENEIERSIKIQEKICQFFENSLYNIKNENAFKYLQSRSLSKEQIKKFRLGFADSDFKILLNFLEKENFSEKEILESGVFAKDKNIYCRFRNRVIFPIINNKNQIIAYGGRILDNSLPKYLNSPETKLFSKRNNLYNFSQAKQAIYKNKYAILVEGYMDVISLDSYQIFNSVAPLGTSVTTEQLQILFRITDNIIICLDGDQAGIRGAKRIINLTLPLISAKNNIKFAFLPENMDPDDFVRKYGKKNMIEFLSEAKNLSEILFQFEKEKLEINSDSKNIPPEKKTILQSNLIDKTNLIKDDLTKKNFLNYYKDLLFFLGKKRIKQNNYENVKKNIISKSSLKTDLILELNILNIIYHFPKLLNYQDPDLEIKNIILDNEVLENIKEDIFENIENEDFNLKDHLNKKYTDLNQIDLIKNKILEDNKIIDEISALRQIKISYFKLIHKKISNEYSFYINSNLESDLDNSSKVQELFKEKTNIEKIILELEKSIL